MEESMKQKTLKWLEHNKIPFEKMEHEAVFTVEEMNRAGISAKGGVCKNLFLRDAKGKKHFLVVAPEEKRVDLAAVSVQLASTKLSFASADRLKKYLGVEQGSVSPLGVLNDVQHEVTVAFDRDLQRVTQLGIHPNDNTATVWLAFEDLRRSIAALGNQIVWLKL